MGLLFPHPITPLLLDSRYLWKSLSCSLKRCEKPVNETYQRRKLEQEEKTLEIWESIIRAPLPGGEMEVYMYVFIS